MIGDLLYKPFPPVLSFRGPFSSQESKPSFSLPLAGLLRVTLKVMLLGRVLTTPRTTSRSLTPPPLSFLLSRRRIEGCAFEFSPFQPPDFRTPDGF